MSAPLTEDECDTLRQFALPPPGSALRDPDPGSIADLILRVTDERVSLRDQLARTQQWLDEFQGSTAAASIRIMTLEKALDEALDGLDAMCASAGIDGPVNRARLRSVLKGDL